jgi:regulator of sigma E protease
LQSLIEANLGKEVSLVYERGGQETTINLVPRAAPPPGEGAMGIIMTNPTRPIGLGAAVSRGAQAAYEYSKNVLALPVRMIRGTVSAEEGRPIGFKGMFDIYQTIQNNLYFFMVISLSLGIFNLFPIPALDGGRILLTLPEILLRRRIPPRYENVIHLVGFALLLILMIYINVQDFINPIQLPK